AFKRLWTLDRRRAVVHPDALKIGMAIGAARRPPRGSRARSAAHRSRRRRLRGHGRDRKNRTHRPTEKSTAHVSLRSLAHQRVRRREQTTANAMPGNSTPGLLHLVEVIGHVDRRWKWRRARAS